MGQFKMNVRPSALDCVSPLFVPADRLRMLEKAICSGADGIILDWEDAVSPEAKQSARNNSCEIAIDIGLPLIVRVNGHGTRWWADDLVAIASLSPAAVMVPKADLDSVAQIIAGGCPPLIPLVETAKGLAQARSIALLPEVARLAFGSIDYSVDIGAEHCPEALNAARSEIVLASRLAGLSAPLDGVTLDVRDEGAASNDARLARSMGFGGKLCIHPHQIPPVRKGFRPSSSEVDRARKIIAAPPGVSQVDGVMVDLPVRSAAEALLRRAATTGII